MLASASLEQISTSFAITPLCGCGPFPCGSVNIFVVVGSVQQVASTARPSQDLRAAAGGLALVCGPVRSSRAGRLVSCEQRVVCAAAAIATARRLHSRSALRRPR